MKMQLMEEINNVKLEQTNIKSKIDNLQNQINDLKSKEDADNSKLANFTNELNDFKGKVKIQDDKISLLMAIDESQNRSISNVSDLTNQQKQEVLNLTSKTTNISDNFESFKRDDHHSGNPEWIEGDNLLLIPIGLLFLFWIICVLCFWRNNKKLKKYRKELVKLMALLKEKKVPSLQEILNRTNTEEKESFISSIRQSTFRKSTSLELSAIKKVEEIKCELK